MTRTPFILLVVLLLGPAVPGPASATGAASLELAGPVGAAVILDGRPLGFFPLDAAIELEPGRHELLCELPGHVDYRQEIVLDGPGAVVRIQVRMQPLSRRTALGSNLLLAGLGQQYLGHRTRGLVYSAAEIGGLLAALAGEIQRSNERRDFLLLQDEYDRTINADRLTELRAAADQAYADMEDMESLRNTGLAVAAGAVLVSILDAYFSFPAVTAGTGETPVRTAAAPADRVMATTWQPAVHAGLRLSF
ncbi:MAG: PEGA domain-containing protein [bacterium]